MRTSNIYDGVDRILAAPRSRRRSLRPSTVGVSAASFALLAFALLVFAPGASASKQVVDFFGGEGTLGGQFTEAHGVAVNSTGAGGVPAGTVYVTDGGLAEFGPTERGNRVERFTRNDNGTPADTTDDSYEFVSAWGAGVETGGGEYQICTVAADCRAGTAEGGNGSLSGDGAVGVAAGIAVDQETGNVYVLDSGASRTGGDNFRVNVYTAAGAFLRSFGWDVVESGPDNAGTGYEVCTATAGDVCKAGTAGSGVGQLGIRTSAGVPAPGGIAVSPPDGNPASGTVFVADGFNDRVDTYGLDGASPSSFGSATQFPEGIQAVAVDSRGVVYAYGQRALGVQRYDSENADGGGIGFLEPIFGQTNEVQRIEVTATGGQFRLSFEGSSTGDLAFNADSQTVRQALEGLPSIGPGNVGVFANRNGPQGIPSYEITFQGARAHSNVEQLTASNGSTPLSGGSIGVVTVFQGTDGPLAGTPETLAVDPDSDATGPETDVLYVAGSRGIQQFGPSDPPGLSSPPSAADATHATSPFIQQFKGGLAIDELVGRIYVAAEGLSSGFSAPGVYVVDTAGPPPTASLDSLSGVTAHGLIAHATIDPNGPPNTQYHFEYSTDGAHWTSTPSVVLGHQETPQSIEATIEPSPAGLEPNTSYRVRLVAGRKTENPIVTPSLTATTEPAPPLVETTGAPVWGTGTARLSGRVDPQNSTTTYRFEYGTQGPCDSNPCASTAAKPAGAGNETELIAEEVGGLEPATTYHYRLVAEGGGTAAGGDMTVTTRGSEALNHGNFPGPPGSDRAYEMVSLADTSGNPVGFASGFAADGNTALYGIFGGTPLADSGGAFSLYYATRPPGEHPETGWRTSVITPPRERLTGTQWLVFSTLASSDLSRVFAVNTEIDRSHPSIWRLNPGGGAESLFTPVPPQTVTSPNGAPGSGVQTYGFAADGSRAIAALEGGVVDPAYPAAGGAPNFYDLDHSPPRLVSLLPGNVPAGCGVSGGGAFLASNAQISHFVSADGSLVFFPSSGGRCGGPSQVYMREIAQEETKLISGPPIQGPICRASFLKATATAAFFVTSTDLDSADTADGGCSPANNDVYRYDLATGAFECVTCVAARIPAEVKGEDQNAIYVSDDGSRVYFSSERRLAAGAPEGRMGIYRVDVASRKLALVAAASTHIGPANTDVFLSPDGSKLVFRSAEASLDPLGGASTNGGTRQYYLYDDASRSLTCVSCPPDGEPPLGNAAEFRQQSGGTNVSPIADGGDFAFATETPLVGADQNTPASPEPNSSLGGSYFAGTDVYEWRDGRPLLVTDGLTHWSYPPPAVQGISHSGRDLFFTAAAQYTPDALDANVRLYDARIGGGIAFPAPAKPCPLEVCQGTPKGAPEEQAPGTSDYRGAGNPAPPTRRCAKGKVRRHGRCVRKTRRPRRQKHANGANRNRRTHR